MHSVQRSYSRRCHADQVFSEERERWLMLVENVLEVIAMNKNTKLEPETLNAGVVSSVSDAGSEAAAALVGFSHP